MAGAIPFFTAVEGALVAPQRTQTFIWPAPIMTLSSSHALRLPMLSPSCEFQLSSTHADTLDGGSGYSHGPVWFGAPDDSVSVELAVDAASVWTVSDVAALSVLPPSEWPVRGSLSSALLSSLPWSRVLG